MAKIASGICIKAFRLRPISVFVPAFSFSILSSCISTGYKFNEEQRKQFQVGKTTCEDIVKIAGEPESESLDAQRGLLPRPCGDVGTPIRTLTYTFNHRNLFSGSANAEISTFYCKDEKVLCHTTFSKLKF